MANDRNWLLGVLVGLLNRHHEALREQVRTDDVPSYAGEVWLIPDPPQPEMHLGQVPILSQEPGHENDGLAVTARNAEPVIDRGEMKREPIDGEEGLDPQGAIRRFVAGE